jgi:hypothetical protein
MQGQGKATLLYACIVIGFCPLVFTVAQIPMGTEVQDIN